MIISMLVKISLSNINRYYMIERAKDAQVIGIVVGTLGVGKYGLLF